MSLPPNRTCVGCRRVREKKDLLRLSFDGRSIRIDPKGRLPGRGLYVCRDEARLLLAERREVLGSSRLDREEPLLGLIGLARRGAGIEIGLRQCVARLRGGEGSVLVTARDISERAAREVTEA